MSHYQDDDHESHLGRNLALGTGAAFAASYYLRNQEIQDERERVAALQAKFDAEARPDWHVVANTDRLRQLEANRDKSMKTDLALAAVCAFFVFIILLFVVIAAFSS